MADQLKAAALRIGGKYNWKNQAERLIYMGLCEPRNGHWHQFALIESPTVVWCEVLPADLDKLEVTQDCAAPVSVPTVQAGDAALTDERLGAVWNMAMESAAEICDKSSLQPAIAERIRALKSAAPSQPVAGKEPAFNPTPEQIAKFSENMEAAGFQKSAPIVPSDEQTIAQQPWNDHRIKLNGLYIGCGTKSNADIIMSALTTANAGKEK